MQLFYRTRSPGRNALVCAGLAALVYVTMLIFTLPQLSALAGQPPFDLRPTGYDLTDAIGLLEALGSGGRKIYLWRQLPLDVFYPLLLAFTLIFAMQWAAGTERMTAVVRAGTALAAFAAACDYAENIGIALMLTSWPTVSPDVVGWSSKASILKAVATTLAMVTTLVVIWRGKPWQRP